MRARGFSEYRLSARSLTIRAAEAPSQIWLALHTALSEHLYRRNGLERGVGSDTLVLFMGNHAILTRDRYRNDFLRKRARPGGRRRPLVTLQGVSVQAFAIEPVFFRDHFGA